LHPESCIQTSTGLHFFQSTFVIFLLFKKDATLWVIFSVLAILLAEYLSHISIAHGDAFTPQEIFQYNFSALILSSFVGKNAAQRIQKEEELLRQNLEDRYDEISKLNLTHASLVAMIGHDISNPLTSIHFNNHILMHKYDDLDIKQHINSLEQTTKNLSQLLKQVIALKAVESGKLTIRLKKVNISKILQNSINDVRHQADQKNIQLNVVSQDNLFVMADEFVLRNSVINNILMNAIKFSYPNKIIDISLSETSSNKVKLVIRDYGIGIPTDIEPFIFKHDVSTTRKGTQNEPGTGFGLPLAKLFIDRFNASISVKTLSKGFDGTEFTILLDKVEGDK
jgi:signal transduction histidine kinase